MVREKVLKNIKELGDNHIIDPYIYDVLTDGSSYAETFMQQLQPAEDEQDLLQLIKVVFK